MPWTHNLTQLFTKGIETVIDPKAVIDDALVVPTRPIGDSWRMLDVDYDEFFGFEEITVSKVCPADRAVDIWLPGPPRKSARTAMESLMPDDEIPDRDPGVLQFMWGGDSGGKLFPTEHQVVVNLFGRTAKEAFAEAFSDLPSSTSRSLESSSTQSTPPLQSDKMLPDVQLGSVSSGPASPTSPAPHRPPLHAHTDAPEANHSEHNIHTDAMPLTVVAEAIRTQQLVEDVEDLPSRMESSMLFSEPSKSAISTFPRIKKKPVLEKKEASTSQRLPEGTGGKIKNLFDVPRQQHPRNKKRLPSYNEEEDEFDGDGDPVEASGSQALGQHKCPYQWCGKRFTRKNDVKRHLQNAAVHKGDAATDAWSPTRCRRCHAELSRADACRRHEARAACWKRTLPGSKKHHLDQRKGEA